MIEIVNSPLQEYIELAIRESIKSPCRSKRAVVIWDGRGVVSSGYNSPPENYKCNNIETCGKECTKRAVHAEQAALLNILKNNKHKNREEQEMLHVKTVESKLVRSNKPSCIDCSKLILFSGIKKMWLFEQDE